MPKFKLAGVTVLVTVIVSIVALNINGCSSSDDESQDGVAAEAAAAPASATSGGSRGVTTPAGYQLAQQFDMNIQVTSTSFNSKRRIPKKNACIEIDFITGIPSTNAKKRPENISPPLTWGELPAGTVTVALVVDSDQGTTIGVKKPAFLDSENYFEKFKQGAKWVHWVVWNIPAEVNGLSLNVPTSTAALPDIGPNTMQGTNSELEVGWYGPCPPPVTVYHGRSAIDQVTFNYTFTLYAVDKLLEGLSSETTKDDLLMEIDGHILGAGEAAGEHTARIIKKAS